MSRIIENPYENFIALSRYARWMPEEKQSILPVSFDYKTKEKNNKKRTIY